MKHEMTYGFFYNQGEEGYDVRILDILKEKPLNIKEICEKLSATRTKIQNDLKILLKLQLIVRKKFGCYYYGLQEEIVVDVKIDAKYEEKKIKVPKGCEPRGSHIIPESEDEQNE